MDLGLYLWMALVYMLSPLQSPLLLVFLSNHYFFTIIGALLLQKQQRQNKKQTNKNGKVCAHVTFLNDRGM